VIDTEISEVARFQEKLDLVVSKHKISVSYGFSQTMLSAALSELIIERVPHTDCS
jgi:hypothetical protein